MNQGGYYNQNQMNQGGNMNMGQNQMMGFGNQPQQMVSQQVHVTGGVQNQQPQYQPQVVQAQMMPQMMTNPMMTMNVLPSPSVQVVSQDIFSSQSHQMMMNPIPQFQGNTGSSPMGSSHMGSSPLGSSPMGSNLVQSPIQQHQSFVQRQQNTNSMQLNQNQMNQNMVFQNQQQQNQRMIPNQQQMNQHNMNQPQMNQQMNRNQMVNQNQMNHQMMNLPQVNHQMGHQANQAQMNQHMNQPQLHHHQQAKSQQPQPPQMNQFQGNTNQSNTNQPSNQAFTNIMMLPANQQQQNKAQSAPTNTSPPKSSRMVTKKPRPPLPTFPKKKLPQLPQLSKEGEVQQQPQQPQQPLQEHPQEEEPKEEDEKNMLDDLAKVFLLLEEKEDEITEEIQKEEERLASIAAAKEEGSQSPLEKRLSLSSATTEGGGENPNISSLKRTLTIGSINTLESVKKSGDVVKKNFSKGLSSSIRNFKKFTKRKKKRKKPRQLESSPSNNCGGPNFKLTDESFIVDIKDIKLLREIGRGGSDTVIYTAKWQSQIVAFKQFKTSSFGTDVISFEEFEKEMKLLATLSHPYVLRFFGACIKPPRCPLSKRMELLEQTANSMMFIHNKSIIHRDLKLENVLVSKHQEARLMDFGLSRVLDSINQIKTQSIGTPFYMAPEIMRTDYDNKIDVFSFAIMVYIVFTRKYLNPYDVKDTRMVPFRVSNDPKFRPKLEVLENSDIPKWMIEDVVVKGWADDPKIRPSFTEIWKMFEDHKDDVLEGEEEEEEDAGTKTEEKSEEKKEEEKNKEDKKDEFDSF